MRKRSYRRLTLDVAAVCLSAIVILATASSVAAVCPEEAPLKNYTGSGSVVCPCFATGEEAGAVLQAPAEHYPIEILRVGIGWGSVYGGTPQSLEEAIKVYKSGLPNPGTPIFTLEGPVLNDGYINEFNLEPSPGEIIDSSGSFTVTLEFLNANAGNTYAPSMIHDGNGCQAGKNVVFAIPGGWYSACALGVTGDWIVYAVYRRVNCGAGAGDEIIVSSQPAWLARPQPNPFRGETQISFFLAEREMVDLSVTDVRGRRVATLASGEFAPGVHSAAWSGRADDGTAASPGIYFVTMEAGSARHSQRVVLSK
ncbi:MAG: FlgD immunoglobulin-like domain containing protein [bacterium]